MDSSVNVIDTELALERAGGNPDLARELFGMLQTELPNYATTIRHHFDSGDFSSLQEAVHKLHGAATYCGVPALKAAALSTETDLKQQKQECYAEGVESLLNEIGRVQAVNGLEL